MSEPVNPASFTQKTTALLFTGVIGIAIVGFFVGVNAGVPQASYEETAHENLAEHKEGHPTVASALSVIPANSYSQMRRLETGPTSQWKAILQPIPQPVFDLQAEIHPSSAAKQHSTATRAQRRAYNGAPPVVPHAVERTSDSACYACHGQGVRIGERLANRMSHQFLANCLQCHAAPPPQPFAKEMVSVANDFTGLPAPLQGQRAFPGAPPTIPHSTWMRNECLSCHGKQAGWAGLEVTHPWRSNCQQCHAPSAELEQNPAPVFSGFVPEPEVKRP